MKNSLLIALLGLTVTVAVPSVASADSDKKFVQSKNYKSAQNHNHKQKNRNVRKHSHHRHGNKTVVKVKPHHHKPRKHSNSNKALLSFFLSTATSTPRVTYTNSHTHKNKHRTYKKPRYASSVYARQDRQHQRIRKGVRSGQLVKHEAQQLRQEQHRIDRKLAKFQRDGRLNRKERAKIHKKLDIAANNIRRKMNNRVTRYSKPRYERDNRRYEYARR